jgi:hypothetical protein
LPRIDVRAKFLFDDLRHPIKLFQDIRGELDARGRDVPLDLSWPRRSGEDRSHARLMKKPRQSHISHGLPDSLANLRDFSDCFERI